MSKVAVCLMVWSLAGSTTAADPDFEHFQALIEQTLNSTGSGAYIGDRTEMYRFTEDGWEIQMMMIWTGQDWHLLALRLHHPDRIAEVEGQWQDRYDRLLKGLDRHNLPDFEVPELIEVPPPGYLPAIPEEYRSRSFQYGGYWYEARWINDGGLDLRAVWALRSYELVASP